MYVGPDSLALASTALPALLHARARRGGGGGAPLVALLDLCCGSGVLGACAAAALGPSAVAVDAADASPRAARFTRFNFALNALAPPRRVVEGDLYAALPPGVRYDTILCNPPFVAAPRDAATAARYDLFSDGGADGARVVDRVLGGAQSRLRAPHGALAMVTELAAPAPLERAARSGARIVAGAPRDALEYARRRGGGDAASWVAHLESHGLERVLRALLVVRQDSDEGGVFETGFDPWAAPHENGPAREAFAALLGDFDP